MRSDKRGGRGKGTGRTGTMGGREGIVIFSKTEYRPSSDNIMLSAKNALSFYPNTDQTIYTHYTH